MSNNTKLIRILLMAAIIWMTQGSASAQDDEDIGPQPAWVGLSSSERKEVMAFAEDYKDFMSRAKTEISFVSEAVKIVEAAGFRELKSRSSLRSAWTEV